MNVISPHMLFLGLLALCHLMVHAAPVAPQKLYHPAIQPTPSYNTLLSRASTFEVKISVVREYIGTADEHWALRLLPSKERCPAQYVDSRMMTTKLQEQLVKPFGVTIKPWQYKKTQKLTDIGVVDLGTEEVFKATQTKLMDMRLEKEPREKGGNCVDYVEMWIRALHKPDSKRKKGLGDKITLLGDKELKVFMDLKNPVYDGIYERTWGAKVKKVQEEAQKQKALTQKAS